MDIKQRLAQAVHAQWSIWQAYQNSKLADRSKADETGTVEFLAQQWQEWNRKSNTRYQDLKPEEQKSVRGWLVVYERMERKLDYGTPYFYPR